MGILAKQSIWNSLTLFLGVFLGAVNMILLFPLVLEPEQFGLTRILGSVGILAAQVAMMGMPAVLIKFLHRYRKKEGSSYGLLPFVLLSGIIGAIVVVVIMYFGKSIILLPYANSAKTFADKYFLLFPLIFFITLNGVLSNYLKAIFHSVFQLIVSELIMRLTLSISLVMYYFGLFDFDIFMWLFILLYGFSTLLLIVYLLKIKELDLKFNVEVLKRTNRKEFYKYGVANFLTGIANSLSNRIDVLMIGAMVGTLVLGGNGGLMAAAIYTYGAYMCSIIEMPSRAISSIGVSLVAKAWEENDLKTIAVIYQKSSINQMIAGALVFLGIWVNIDSIVFIMDSLAKEGYNFSEIKYVVLFLGIGKLFHVSSGINGSIIITSKYYLVGTYIVIGLVVITILTNWILIPIYGIVGAALATTITLFLFNISSLIFLWIKFKLQPFSFRTIILLFIIISACLMASWIPIMESPFIDILLRSLIILIIYIPLVIGLKISPDANVLFYSAVSRLGIRYSK